MKNEGPNVFGQMPAVPKFLASLLLMLALSVTAAAQNRKISIDMQNVTVKEFFAEIEKRSDYTFAYNNSEIDLAARVSVRAVDEEIVAVVDRTLAPQRLRARIEGNRVVLSPGRAAVPPPSSAKPVKAEKTISGRVTAVSGEPIVGASVLVKGTSIGNVTGISGEYTISAEPEQTLSFAFLGYDTKEVKVGSRTTIDVTLTEQNKQISEVVVVGYAPMRKSDFTGSIASVKASELSVTAPTVGQSLVGKVAGVEVHQTSGAPGDGVTIRVRGVNSLSASSDPLYVIDGIPLSNNSASLYSFGENMSSLATLNLTDIESIEVLKDAASAAIYGARASNGVIIVTTKKGSPSQGPQVVFDVQVGFSAPTKKWDLLSSREQIALVRPAIANIYAKSTGTLAASLLDMDFKSSVRACMGGVLLAGCIMGALSVLGVSAFGAVAA